jgi:hypothetical protein
MISLAWALAGWLLMAGIYSARFLRYLGSFALRNALDEINGDLLEADFWIMTPSIRLEISGI